MNQLVKIDRNQKIKEAGKLTRDRHASMTCKTYEVKIDKSHLSKTKSNFLQSVFREAKWLYNYILSSDDIFAVPMNLKEVTVLNKDKVPEIRELDNLSSHMVQEVINRTRINIVALNRSKKAGNKVGKLKYKSYVNSVPLKQYNNTYKVTGKSIKLQGCKTTTTWC
jgi:putative transposase